MTDAAPSTEVGPIVVPPTPTPQVQQPTGTVDASTSTKPTATAPIVATAPVTLIPLDQAKAAFSQNVPSALHLTGTACPSTTWIILLTDHITLTITALAPSTVRGYLCLGLPHSVSTPLNGNKKFSFPTQPHLTPNWVAPEWDSETRASERDYHNNEINNYKNMVTIDTALQTFLLELIPVAYFPKSFRRPAGLSTMIWPLNYHAFDLIEDLYNKWNFPTPEDEQLHHVAFNAVWDLNNGPIMEYLDEIQRADHLAKLMDNPYTQKQLTTQAYTHIKNTIKLSGPMGKADKEWLELTTSEQTLEKLCDLFGDAYIFCRQRRIPIEAAPRSSDEGAFAVGQPLPPQASDDDSLASVHSILANTLANTFHSMAADWSEKMDAKMAAHMSQLQSMPPAPTAAPLPTTVFTPQPSTRGVVPPPAPPVPPLPAPTPTTARRGTPNPVKRHANHLYCSSCGCDVDHSSPDCPKKREGHNDLLVHKEQAKQIRDADKSLRMPCLKGIGKTMWPAES